jgi:hypothetical protein
MNFPIIIKVSDADEFRLTALKWEGMGLNKGDDFGKTVKRLVGMKGGNMPNPIWLKMQMEEEMKTPSVFMKVDWEEVYKDFLLQIDFNDIPPMLTSRQYFRLLFFIWEQIEEVDGFIYLIKNRHFDILISHLTILSVDEIKKFAEEWVENEIIWEGISSDKAVELIAFLDRNSPPSSPLARRNSEPLPIIKSRPRGGSLPVREVGLGEEDSYDKLIFDAIMENFTTVARRNSEPLILKTLPPPRSNSFSISLRPTIALLLSRRPESYLRAQSLSR